MLFAELDAGTQQGIGYAVVALVSLISGKLIGYWDDRDKRKDEKNKREHDTRLLLLEAKVAACEEHREECKELKAEHETLKKSVERIRKRADRHHPEDSHDPADAPECEPPVSDPA